MNELRLNFSDYPAIEQEFDAGKAKPQQNVFLFQINGEWAYYVNKKTYGFLKTDIVGMYHKVKEDFPELRARCVIDKDIEGFLRKKQQQRQEAARKQLMINFKGVKNEY